jgi:RNA polymerase sigma-70 factor (ECF subfamily)
MTEIDEAELREVIPRLRRFARALTHDPTAADDLVQTCLERAVSRWKSRHEARSLQAWLFSILYRRFLDERKRAGRFSLLLDVFRGPRDVVPSAEEVVIARASLASFDRLPPEQRALMLLVAVEGLSYGEAAEALGVPIGTVMSRLSRARKALRELTDRDVSPPSLRVLK